MFDVQVNVESQVNECDGGIWALVNYFSAADKSTVTLHNCAWRQYRPAMPIYEASWLNSGDKGRDYVSWRCNDDL